jgi:hypothetical protein
MAWYVTFAAIYMALSKPRTWFEHFAYVVTDAGFLPSAHDPTFFVHLSRRGLIHLLLYVDDTIIIGDDFEYIDFVKARLSDKFLMYYLSPPCYFLGIEISSTSNGFFISQENYIQDLIDRASLSDECIVETLMEINGF